MLWAGSINKKGTWTPIMKPEKSVRRKRRKRSGPGRLRCRGSVPSGVAGPARQSSRRERTPKENVLNAEPNSIAASSARFSILRAASNAQSPSRRGFPRRTRGTSAPFSCREQPSNAKLHPLGRWMPGRLLRTFSKSSLPKAPSAPGGSLCKVAKVCAQLKIFCRAASEMATTAGFLILLSTEIA